MYLELSTRSINVLKKRLKLKQLRELESIDYENDERLPKSCSYRYLNLGEKSVLEICMACKKHNISYEPFVEDYISRSPLSKKAI